MMTHEPRHLQHLSGDHGELSGRQTKRVKLGSHAVWLVLEYGTRVLEWLLGWLLRRWFAHAGKERQCIRITKNRSTFCLLLTTTVLVLVSWAQPAFGHDAPMLLPARLDFDASGAPKNCNSVNTFKSILGAWMDATVLRDDAERRLVVRIRRSSTGGKRADVSLIDAQGAIVVEWHDDYVAEIECFRVLWNVALNATKFLGAFEPPPPKEPITPPKEPITFQMSSPCPLCPPERPCPTCAQPIAPLPTITPMPFRSFIGIGAFVGSGIYSKLGFGPHLLLGFVPSLRLSFLHVELEGAWTSQTSPSSMTSESSRMQSIPFVGSLCLARGIVRFCGGLATTILFTNQSSDNDELQLMLGGNFRVGTQLFTHGTFSIRADLFGRFAFAQRAFGKTTMTFEAPTPFTAGVAVMGMWSFD